MNRNAVVVPPQSGTSKSVVVFLHGYGSNAEDLISLAPYFAPLLPDTLFISPNAPEPCELGPYGFQWFSLLDRSAAAMDAGIAQAAPQLEQLLNDIVAEYAVPLSRMALVGFSQGTMMALHVAPRLPTPVAAVVGFSGRLLQAERLAVEVKSRPSVLLVHGTADEMVPYSSLAEALTTLETCGFTVETETCRGLGHGIDESGLQHAQNFLRQHLI